MTAENTPNTESEEIQKRLDALKQKIDTLTVLFSKNEISEESYKNAVRTIEREMETLRSGREVQLSASGTKPSDTWFLVPFFFGIIGGLVGYVGVKDRDEQMAFDLLVFGIVWTILLAILFWVYLFSLTQ